jgi:transcription antitermination factor NusG
MKSSKKNNLDSKGVNKDNIFDLFKTEGEVTSMGDKVENIKSPKLSPSYIKVGMFTKLILNHQVFHTRLEKFLKEEEPTYQTNSTKNASAFIVYNKAWFYLNQINLSKKRDVSAILNFNPNLLNNSLNSTLKYFEYCEEYEKCAYIFKIQQFLKENQK